MTRTEPIAPGLVLVQLIRQHTGCASYCLASVSNRSCIIVDPLMDKERYEMALDDLGGYNVLGLIDTHTHADHVSGLRCFSEYFPLAFMAVHESSPVKFRCEKLKDGERLSERLLPRSFFENRFDIKVIHTPGHTSDHICLLIESRTGGALLSGDCLFVGDVGRTDLGRGDNHKLFESLFQKILTLDPSTEVYPAHVGEKHFLSGGETKTTIGKEKERNPALQVRGEKEFVKYMTKGWPPKPEYYQEIVSINLGEISLVEDLERIEEGKSTLHSAAPSID